MEKSIQIFTKSKILKDGPQCISLSVILVNSVYRKDKNYYPQVFLKECKLVKEKKMSKFITDDIKISPGDSDKQNSDEENSDKENSNEVN